MTMSPRTGESEFEGKFLRNPSTHCEAASARQSSRGDERGFGDIFRVLQDSFALGVWATLGTTTSIQMRSALMARHVFRLNRERESAFDIVSYGRRGPGRPAHFTREQIEQIARTVRRPMELESGANPVLSPL